MSPLPAKPTASICSDKKRLGAAYLQALRDVMALHKKEMAALLEDTELHSFDIALRLARRKRDKAKRLYVLHIRAHEC